MRSSRLSLMAVQLLKKIRQARVWVLYLLYCFVCFLVFFPEKERKIHHTWRSVCIFWASFFLFFLRLFLDQLVFPHFALPLWETSDFWDVSGILEKRARVSSCRCCHCAPWHIHPEVFFFFFFLQRWKKNFRLNENDKIPCSESRFPALFSSFSSDSVVVERRTHTHKHTKGAIQSYNNIRSIPEWKRKRKNDGQ